MLIKQCFFISKIIEATRMHSSRMRTVRSSDRISGGCLLPGVSAPGGVCSQGGCLLPGGVCFGGSAPGGVCSRGVGGGSAPGGLLHGGCLLLGDLLGGCGIPACTEADTPTPPCGQTDACKNITFATSLRTVIISVVKSLAS